MTTSLTAEDVEQFRRVVTRRLGLRFADTNTRFLEELLGRRLKATNSSCRFYFAALENEWPTEEARVLAQELTVGETYFFRNMDQFRALTQVALSERVGGGHRWGLRLLSAGCASGEEAYSMAIMVRETGADVGREVSIRAVDVNPAALHKAKRARYTSWALRETPPDIRRKWFHADGHEVALHDTVRAAVRFEERNLAIADPELWQPNAYDVVFCRNVIMYFSTEVAQSLIARIAQSLAPNGYLFLGHAETLRGLSQEFQLCHTHGTFYYQRKEVAAAVASGFAPARSAFTSTVPALATLTDGADTWVESIREAAERVRVLSQSAAPLESATATLSPTWDLGLAVSLLQSERFSDALAVVLGFPPESACDTEVLLLRAVLLSHGGQLSGAEEACERLLAIDGLNAGAHYVLALCREGAGDRKGAEDHDQVAAHLDPAFAMPRLHLGLMARRNGDREAARRELERALVLLGHEDASRLLLFGGGFSREALIALCGAELMPRAGAS